MSSSYPDYNRISVQTCLRCGVVLPPNEYRCYRCGYINAPSRAGAAKNGAPPAPSERRRRRNRRELPLAFIIGVAGLFILLLEVGVYGSQYLSAQTRARAEALATQIAAKPEGSPLFADTFANDANGWNLQGEAPGVAVSLAGGALTLTDTTHTLLWELVPGTRTFSDFRLLVDATLTKGDQNNGYGVYIRGTANQQSDLATYYRFELYGDGTYAIFKGVVDANGQSTATKIVDYTQCAAIQPQGQVNHILITANGPTLSFMVNGQTLKVFNDSSYTSGSVALFVSNLPEAAPGAQARFSNFSIYPLH
ncbi:MAG TPA: family 16 glycoside hydrolase [Ktedonobacteraceae bacterium]|nr:family 16 glycoside hydrolase [Ktedonobacteraceae bacterium]